MKGVDIWLQGSIPYVPFLRAPYYVWVGRVPQIATVLAENKVEAPPMFPPTFLYTTSWEDPRPDVEASLHPAQHALASAIAIQEGYDTRQGFQVLEVKKEDTVLTLTSGGCNALNLLLHGAGHVRWPLPSVLLLAAHYLWEDVVLPSCGNALLVPADIEFGTSTRLSPECYVGWH